MKKVLLLTTAALLASSAMAAGVTRAKSVVKTPTPVENCLYTPLAVETFDQLATPGSHAKKVATKASPDDGTPKAFYKRPAGAFYGVHTSDEITADYKYATFYAPYIFTWPFADVTYVQNVLNMGDNPTYSWEYYLYNHDTKLSEMLTSTGPELQVSYNSEVDSIPRLISSGSEGYATYTMGGWKVTNKELVSYYRSMALAKADYATGFSNTAGKILWCSPKFRAANSNRDGSKTSAATYSTGAKDADGGTTGKFFGRNYSGIDALCMAFEKPEHPYLLRHVGVAFQGLAFNTNAKPFDLSVTVYKLNELPAYNESESVIINPTEVIAVGKFTVDPDEFTSRGITSGLIPFSLEMEDDGSGLTIEIQPEIDFPILIEFTGYNNSNVADFTLLQSTDLYDEGYGEHCYMVRTLSDGSKKYQGLNYFFNSGERKAGLTIYADVAHPFMTPNFSVDVPVRTFNAAGVCQENGFVSGGKTYKGNEMCIYTYSPSDEVEISLEDGSELPEWLTVNVSDEMKNEEWSGLIVADFAVTPLPDGVKGRKANVKLSIPGARMVVAVVQGEPEEPGVPGDVNGDGKVDVEDINIAIDIILENTTADSYPAADINGDGKVDVEDINAIIDIILAN